MSFLKKIKEYNSLSNVNRRIGLISDFCKKLIPILTLLLVVMFCHITYKYIEYKYWEDQVGTKATATGYDITPKKIWFFGK